MDNKSYSCDYSANYQSTATCKSNNFTMQVDQYTDLLYILTSDMELCLPELLCRAACGDENRLIMRASAGGGGSGGGGWLGSLGRQEDEDPDEDDVIDARVCSGMFQIFFIKKII